MGKVTATPQQIEAWEFYGWPGGGAPSRYLPGPNGPAQSRTRNAVGEVRYVIGWMADQMTRLDWRITLGGETAWRVTLDSGEVIRSDPEEQDTEAPTSPVRASARLLEEIGWGSRAVRKITTNLFVAGELFYMAIPTGSGNDVRWRVVSVINDKKDDYAKEALYTVRGLWEHPADEDFSDAPLFGILDVLDDLDWLTRLSRSQSANRASLRGFLGISDQLEIDGAGGDNVRGFIEDAIRRRMTSPDDTSPIVLRGAQSLVEPTSSGMKGLSWVVPNFPYDEKIGERIDRAIHRMAYGLPVPPEVLLGMQAQSRATAFQVEENSYRAHIEPPADMVATIAEKSLALLLGRDDVDVEPDPARLLARRHTVQDAKDALSVGAISYPYYRDALGIPEEAAATDDDLALLARVSGTRETIEVDPANQAASEGVTASTTPYPHPLLAAVLPASGVGPVTGEPLTEDDLERLSTSLYDLDAHLMSTLAGATQQAADRARDRVGAKARTHASLRSALPKTLPHSQVASHLGVDTLRDTGVPVEEVVLVSLVPLAEWWHTTVQEALGDLSSLLGVDLQVSEEQVKQSANLLLDLTATHVLDTLTGPEATPLPAPDRTLVMSVAGGAEYHGRT